MTRPALPAPAPARAHAPAPRPALAWVVTACVVAVGVLAPACHANPDAKRLYDDLLSSYNRLIRPVGNNSDRLTVKLGLKLSQLIDVVSTRGGCHALHGPRPSGHRNVLPQRRRRRRRRGHEARCGARGAGQL